MAYSSQQQRKTSFKDTIGKAIREAKPPELKEKKRDNPEILDVKVPEGNGSQKTGPDYEWRGQEPVGGDKGSWVNKQTGEQWHPDLNHGEPVGPHWDYTDRFKNKWRIFPEDNLIP